MASAPTRKSGLNAPAMPAINAKLEICGCILVQQINQTISQQADDHYPFPADFIGHRTGNKGKYNGHAAELIVMMVAEAVKGRFSFPLT